MAKRPEIIPKLQEIAARTGVTVPWERITINRWRPDTCGCSIEQWFDDKDVSVPRAVLYANILETCPEHVASAPGEVLWNTLRGENSRKNQVLAIIEQTIDTDAREATTWMFMAARLSGSDERVLELTMPGVNAANRNAIQGSADLQFGSGAVTVN